MFLAWFKNKYQRSENAAIYYYAEYIQVMKSIDEKELLAWLGTKSDTRDNAAEVKKEMEKYKGQLLEAFAAKGDALLKSKNYLPSHTI